MGRVVELAPCCIFDSGRGLFSCKTPPAEQRFMFIFCIGEGVLFFVGDLGNKETVINQR